MSATALLVEEIGLSRYRALELLPLTAWGLVEAVASVRRWRGGA